MLTQELLIRRGDHALRMPQEKIAWFREQLPWLFGFFLEEQSYGGHILNESFDIKQIYVQRAEAGLWDYIPISCKRREHSFDGRTVHYEDASSNEEAETIYLLDKEGKIVKFAVSVKQSPLNFFFWKRDRPPREEKWRAVIRGHTFSGYHLSVGDKLLAIGSSVSLVAYAVSYCPYTKAAIVYRPPKGRMFAEWLFKEREAYTHKIVEAARKELYCSEA